MRQVNLTPSSIDPLLVPLPQTPTEKDTIIPDVDQGKEVGQDDDQHAHVQYASPIHKDDQGQD